jgi:L-ascorbate metabolism protein UlaG (beta-lactamase superfamily)
VSANTQARLTLRAVGGPTLVLEVGGLRLISDPTFDPPKSYEPRPGVRLTKLSGPALTPDDVGTVDVVLLSHDHHRDNLDDAGRAYLTQVPRVLTTVGGAERLGGGATPMPNWDSVELSRPDGGTLRVTGVPAQHGPDGSEHLVGEVTGFFLTGDGLPSVYVSGDNASLEIVRRVAGRLGPADVAVLFAGGAQLPYLPDAFLTLSSPASAEAARILRARYVVPVHSEGWAHFTQGHDTLRTAFDSAGLTDRLVLLEPGETVTL